jgi:hypothetical protein
LEGRELSSRPGKSPCGHSLSGVATVRPSRHRPTDAPLIAVGGRPTAGAWPRLSETIQRTPDTSPPCVVEDMSVDHRGGDIHVAEQLLDGPDVVAVVEQVRREGVP